MKGEAVMASPFFVSAAQPTCRRWLASDNGLPGDMDVEYELVGGMPTSGLAFRVLHPFTDGSGGDLAYISTRHSSGAAGVPWGGVYFSAGRRRNPSMERHRTCHQEEAAGGQLRQLAAPGSARAQRNIKKTPTMTVRTGYVRPDWHKPENGTSFIHSAGRTLAHVFH